MSEKHSRYTNLAAPFSIKSPPSRTAVMPCPTKPPSSSNRSQGFLCKHSAPIYRVQGCDHGLLRLQAKLAEPLEAGALQRQRLCRGCIRTCQQANAHYAQREETSYHPSEILAVDEGRMHPGISGGCLDKSPRSAGQEAAAGRSCFHLCSPQARPIAVRSNRMIVRHQLAVGGQEVVLKWLECDCDPD
jgi:hypothetical protein